MCSEQANARPADGWLLIRIKEMLFPLFVDPNFLSTFLFDVVG